jgi:hypothetical protein
MKPARRGIRNHLGGAKPGARLFGYYYRGAAARAPKNLSRILRGMRKASLPVEPHATGLSGTLAPDLPPGQFAQPPVRRPRKTARQRRMTRLEPNPAPERIPPPGMVDLRPLKKEFQRLLPAMHPNRVAVMREPDFLPLAEAVAKAETYLRIAASWEDR